MEMTLSSCFTLASIKLHITDLMWKGHKDPNSQLLQKIHETFSSFCGSNLSLQCLHHTHLSEPPSILLAPASTWRSSNATTSWKPSLNSQTRVVNSSQPSAHTSVLACLMLWHCLITRLSPRLDLKSSFQLQVEKLPSRKSSPPLIFSEVPLPRMLLRNCLLSIFFLSWPWYYLFLWKHVI